MLKKLINRFKKPKREHYEDRYWSDILKRYNHLTDGEFIDELLTNYHPPKRKTK